MIKDEIIKELEDNVYKLPFYNPKKADEFRLIFKLIGESIGNVLQNYKIEKNEH